MNNDNQPSKHKKNHRKPIFTVLVILIPIILALLVVAGIFLGRLSVILKDPSQIVVLKTPICSDEIIDRYNTAPTSNSADGYIGVLKSVSSEIESLPGYEKDSSCVFMIYKYYLYSGDAVKARKYANLFDDLSKSGNSINRRIYNPDSIQSIEMDVESLEKSGGNVDGGGVG